MVAALTKYTAYSWMEIPAPQPSFFYLPLKQMSAMFTLG